MIDVPLRVFGSGSGVGLLEIHQNTFVAQAVVSA